MKLCSAVLVLLFFAFCFEIVCAAVSEQELNALTEIYNDADGPDWYTNTNWLTGDPCDNAWCSILQAPIWHLTSQYCVLTDTVRDLSWNNLEGTLADVFDHLRYLTTVSFANNRDLEGPLPETVFNVLSLRTVDLASCNFNGSIPSFSFNTTLTTLYLSGNELDSTVPMSILQSLTLTTLDVSNNELVGTIPDVVSNQNRFQSIDLGRNNLEGAIPLSLISNTTLTFLDLGSNNLNGSIPDEFAAPEMFSNSTRRQFKFPDNMLSGSVPATLLAVPGVSILDLSYNQFTGSLPDTFSASDNVSHYVFVPPTPLLPTIYLQYGSYVYENQLEGTLPASLLSMPRLTSFDGHNNKFTDFGTWVGDLHSTEVSLASNSITAFPTTDQLTGVNTFSLESNLLSGSIPSDIDLTGVRTVNVKYNSLTGTIPDAVYSSLVEFHAASNDFSGSLPEDLDDLYIQTLDVSYNQLTGKLETECPLIENLSLEGNCFHCPLPTCCSQKWCQNASTCQCTVWNSFWPLIVGSVLACCCCCVVLPAIIIGVAVTMRNRKLRDYEQLKDDHDVNS